MKVGIITWCCYYNFGTYLQAYALQTFLKRNGYENYILNDYHYSVERPLFTKIKIALKYFVKNTFLRKRCAYLKTDSISSRQYEDFKSSYLAVDYKVVPLIELNNRYDVFVCGSDQIWNPGGFSRKGNDFYFASFATKPKISYAPSIGVRKIPDEYKKHFLELISDFSFLSVREKSASKVLSDICGKKIETVLDPTLLLDRSDWLKLLSSPKTDTKYLFLYLLTYNQHYVDVAYDFAARHNLRVRVVKSYGINLHIKDAEPAGPLEFLNLLAGASYVMTDSFHATIFSIHYQKDFVIFKRFKDTDLIGQNSRVENLLERVGLKNRLVGEGALPLLYQQHSIDYQVVDERLKLEKIHSRKYLLNALRQIEDERS